MFITENSKCCVRSHRFTAAANIHLDNLGMLLVLLCFMFLIGLMVLIKACYNNCWNNGSSSADSVVQASTISSNVSSTSSIPDAVQYERNYYRINESYVVDIDFSHPPSYEDAVKMPLPLKPITWSRTKKMAKYLSSIISAVFKDLWSSLHSFLSTKNVRNGLYWNIISRHFCLCA